MRCESVSRLKGTRKGRPPSNKPREGTILRELYDKFKANPGIPVAFPPTPVGDSKQSARILMDIRQLTDFYGLDIRMTRGVRKNGNRIPEFTLIGEWFGKIYVDYLAIRMEKHK